MTNPEHALVLDSLRDRERLLAAGRSEYPEKISRFAAMIASTLRNGGKLMICGNGGSAAEGQHFAAEMIVRLTEKYPRSGLPCIALSTDTSVLTACANDLGFDMIFARQVEALGRAGDLLIALSTSGKSENVNRAVKTARKMGIGTVAISGKDGGELTTIADFSIVVPSDSTLRIQEEHLFILHQATELLEHLLKPRE